MARRTAGRSNADRSDGFEALGEDALAERVRVLENDSRALQRDNERLAKKLKGLHAEMPIT